MLSGVRLGVTGGRNYDNVATVFAALDQICKDFYVDAIIEGGATGLDSLARIWSEGRGIPVETYAADWKKWGKAAGPLRNQKMVETIDVLAVFPGGIGTQDMHTRAKKDGRILIFVYE